VTPLGLLLQPQLRCPYTLKPLAQLPELRTEPILPLCLGGPADFDVLVDRQPVAGTHAGDDASFGDNALLVMLRVRHGPTPSAAQGRWGGDSLGSTRKGPYRDFPGVDRAALTAGMAKIAYLAAFELFGDRFLDDPINSAWRSLIQAQSGAEVQHSGIEAMPLGPADRLYEAALFPELKAHEHAITICNFQRNSPLVALKLFGCLTQVFRASQSAGYGLGLLEGRIVICDSINRSIRIQNYTPHFVSFATRYHVSASDIPPFRPRAPV